MPAISFRSLVLDTLATGDAFQNALTALRERAKTMSFTNFNNQAAEVIGERLGVAPHVSRKGENVLTFKKDSAAEQRLSRIRKLHPEFSGKKSNKAETPAVPKAVAKAFERHVLSLGLTKAQLRAMFDATLKGLE